MKSPFFYKYLSNPLLDLRHSMATGNSSLAFVKTAYEAQSCCHFTAAR